MTFRSGDSVHLLTLLVCLLAMLVVIRLGREAGRRAQIALTLAAGCSVMWVAQAIHGLMVNDFSATRGLPLEFCNMANAAAIVALLSRRRLPKAILYFWSLGLCSWAFVTPTITEGPLRISFWVFWLYHLGIALSAVHVIVVEGFRPRFRDLASVMVCTLMYAAFLFWIDAAMGWNYGFLGAAHPGRPTPVDLLGSYPGRVGWMALCVATIFVLLWLPLRRHQDEGVPDEAP